MYSLESHLRVRTFAMTSQIAMDGMRSCNWDRMDDPMLWGILPLSYMFNPDNLRWGLGSYDLCFTNKYAIFVDNGLD
jgi:hypothetical protein